MYKMTASVLLAFLLTGSTLFAQSNDEKQVAEQVETLRKAMLASDTLTLKKLTAEELSYGHSNGLVEDKAAFIDEYVTGKSIFVTLDFSEQTIKIRGDVAIVRNHFTAETNNNHVAGKADILVLQIWQKLKGNWKLVARQAVKVVPPSK